MARVYFARINRRMPNQDSLSGGSFSQELRILADSYRTRFEEPVSASILSSAPTVRRWTAADFQTDASGDFMTGTLGYSEPAGTRLFDEKSWSWVKAAVDSTHGADDESVVPFAIDLRNHNRWVAFSTTTRLRRARFREGLSSVLNQAAADLGLLPQSWEVDQITSRRSVDTWLGDHPLVFNFQRIVKHSNPGRDLDEDRAEMLRLGAKWKKEEYQAEPNSTLNVESAEFRDMLDGTEKGNLELRMSARSNEGGGSAKVVKYSSEETPDQVTISDFGVDLMIGMERVLEELRRYVETDA